MKLDKNSVIGFVLLALLFFGYFYFTRQGQLELERKRKAEQDSIARLAPKQDTSANLSSLPAPDSLPKAANGQLAQPGSGTENLQTVETDLVKITFTNKGAYPKMIELKKYLSLDSQPVKIMGNATDKFSYIIQTGSNATANTSDLYFAPGELSKKPDGSQSLRFTLSDSGKGHSITHQFTIRANDYMIDWTVSLNGANTLLPQNSLNMLWQVQSRQHELDIQGEKRETQIGLMEKGGFDYFTLGEGLNEKFDEGLKWIGVKQKFFNSTIIAKNGFSYADFTCNVPADSLGVVASTVTNLRSTFPASTQVTIPFQLYAGPNDYAILKGYKLDLEDMVNLGQGFYAFVKYINRWIVLPAWNFFDRMIGSYGLVIALLTIFIRLLTSPLVYTSYLSGAKMKALRPELDVLKEKFKDDQQAFSMEQMKLFRTAGVNPLGGCIPALLQIPIFFALYSFFNSNIALRGEKFWWAKDLSSFDAVITWKTSLPFIGSHISLFTILAVVTSLIISIYSMSMTPDQNNPVLKYMPYIFPILLFGIFNSLPSALTWYYTVSNVITLILQFVIQNYIINHDKILAQIEENKKKPKSKPKWQERLEQMQETQKKVEEMKSKTKKK
ncbi:MAG: membrane protein insertase YidC [Chitinophagaceae bacterium]|nr:membrane protein insertase YidC [Chitinophagaceae bacterium]